MSLDKVAVSVSIGVCAYNEEANVGRLLRNLLYEQNLPFDFEVIVICSGCTDKTPEIVREFCAKDQRVRLVIEPERKRIDQPHKEYHLKNIVKLPRPIVKRKGSRVRHFFGRTRSLLIFFLTICIIID